MGLGIYTYGRFHPQLRENGLDGLLFLALIICGIFVIGMPLQMRSQWQRWNAQEMLVDYLKRGGIMLSAVGGIVLIFGTIFWIISLPARLNRPILLLPLLTLLVPLAAILIDFAQNTVARTGKNLVIGFLLYLSKIYGMLLIQLTTVFTLFALGPAGIVIQLISGINLFALYSLGMGGAERPLLCQWSNVLGEGCTPLLFTFHLGHLLLAWLVMRYGSRAFDTAVDQYRLILETFTQMLQPSPHSR